MDKSPKPKLRPKLRLSYDDLKKIERVVNEEAKGEGVEGRNAIRGVIFNRLMSERFPDSVDEVLSPREFEPVGKYGSIDKIPVDENTLNERLTEMADYIQYGEDASKGSTFFLNKKLAKKRKTDFGGKGGMTIGNHTFYKGYEGQEPVEDINFSHNIEVSYDGYDEGGFVSKFMDMITSPVTGDYRKRLSDMTPEELQEVAPGAAAYKNIFGDRSEKPTSVQMAELGLSMTPVGTAMEVGEELSSDNPSWMNIGLAVAPDLLGLGPAADPLLRAIKGTKFKTAKGSTYEVTDDNTTVRNKAARPEHPNEAGIQPQSKKTIYMPRSELEKFAGVHQNPDMPTEFIPTGPDTAALRLTKDWGPRKAGEILQGTEVKFTLDPEVGLNPVEILDFRNPRGIHFGNEIIEVESNIPKVSRSDTPSRKPQMSNEDYDMRMAALDEIDNITDWQKAAKKEIETGRVVDPQIKTPELEESTKLLLDNKITREEHLANVDKYKPVNAWDALPREPSNKAVVFSLDDGQRKDGFFVLDNAAEMGVNKSSLKIGDLFNGRLDIPAYNRYDTWIVTGSSKNAEKGKHYAKAIHYRAGEGEPVKFIASTKTSEKIGTGEKNKTPYATVQGYIEDLDADAIRAKAAEYLNDPEWTQVGFDPRRQGGFYVRAGENKHVPIREATEVIQIGPLILAKNAKLDMEYSGYNEGGMAMDEQMGMMFKSSRGMAMNEGGDIGETVGVDPVSGNEIPLGSTAENVRDDIPAQLSEGEYVVPADVVRYYGVKFFEDLRTEAKTGFQQMQENGRIGGEPVGMEMAGDDLPFDISELQMVDDGEEQPMMAAGGYMKGYAPGGFESYSPADYQPGGSIGTGGIEVVKYVHPDGREIFIQFINGTPLTMIPEGFEKEATAEEQVAEGVTEQVTRTDDDDGEPSTPIDAPEPIDWAEDATVQDFQDYADNRDSFASKAAKLGVTVLGGIKGRALMGLAERMEHNNVLSGLKSQIEQTEDPSKKSQLQNILDNLTQDKDEDPKEGKPSGIFGGKDSLLDGLEDTDESGTIDFGDTWLGDLLGFDKEGVGVQGDPLGKSWQGSRRDGQTSSDDDGNTPTPSNTGSVNTSAKDADLGVGGNSSSGNSSSGNSSSGNSSSGNSSSSSGSGVSGVNDGEVGEATGGKGDQGLGSGKGGMNKGGLMQKPKNKKNK